MADVASAWRLARIASENTLSKQKRALSYIIYDICGESWLISKFKAFAVKIYAGENVSIV